MSLTKPRAHQLFDIDYKQSVRVLTTTNINLSGGAPATVDGVVMAAKDRVLVIGQNTASENGLYYVTTVGTGANGTWQRSQDAAETGELLAGAIVMVTEGDVYADTQWKLVTDNPIVIGSTGLVWEQNSAFAFGNIFANGTAVLANTVGDTVTFAAGTNISIVGNAAAKSVTISVTGISLNSISNGTSNVDIPVANGNVSTAVDGNTILTVSSGGANVTGFVSASGNVTGGNIITSGQMLATGNITGGNLITAGEMFSGTLRTVGDALINGNLTIQGNLKYINVEDLRVEDPVIIMGTGPNGAPLTGNDGLDRGIYMEYYTTGLGNAFVGWQNSTGNLILATDVEFVSNDVVQVNSYGTLQAGNAYLESAVIVGNIDAGNIATTGNLSATHLSATNSITAGTTITATGNVSGGNINTTGQVTATGNITGGNLGGTNITGTLVTAAQPGITSVGTLISLAVTGNVTGGNLTTAGQVTAVGNITGGNLSGTLIAGTLTTVAQPNITSVGTLTALVVTGNISGGNLETAGQVTATGNITGGNILGNGSSLAGINAFGNIAVAGETTVSADSTSDTLTLVSGSGISILTDAANNTITIGSVSTDSIFATGGSMGTVDEAVTAEEDLGLITSAATINYDLGFIVTSGVLYPEQLVLPSFTVAELGGLSTTPAGQMVFCSNETGGSIPAFSDGTNWRRVSDRQIVS